VEIAPFVVVVVVVVVGGYTGPVVGDERLGVSVEPSQLQVDPAGRLDGGEGVVDEAAKDKFQRVGVTGHGGIAVGAQGDCRRRRPQSSVVDERGARWS
jgi:hypothetical protein